MRTVRYFTVTEVHLKLLKRMRITWNPSGVGAPMVYSKKPYGNSDLDEDLLSIIDMSKVDKLPHEDELDIAREIHFEMETVLQILVSNLSIEEGEYYQEDFKPWRKTKLK